MPEEETKGSLLICESYPALRETFKLMFGKHYDLIFADDPIEITPLLRQNSVRLLIWDIDRPDGFLKPALESLRTNTILTTSPNAIHIEGVLNTLKTIRCIYPELKAVLISAEFKYDFQVTVIQQCGLVRFVTKPWNSAEIVEKIQVILGDMESSIRQWILRVPLATGKTGENVD